MKVNSATAFTQEFADHPVEREVSLLRLYILRAMYLLMAVGLGSTVWPQIIGHSSTAQHMNGVVWALLGTIGLLAFVGVRHPVRMIPLLLFELTWKVIWLIAFALPRWLDGSLDAAMGASVADMSVGAILLFVIPWRHVWEVYVAGAGDRWSSEKMMDA